MPLDRSEGSPVLSIVCPVYNEAENMEALFEVLRAKVPIDLELLIVYDRTDDNTIPVVQHLAPCYPFATRLVQNRFGSGVLNAIKTGFLEARHEAILVLMADLSDDLSIVPEMYRLITAEGFDIVCGSRYMSGGQQIGGPALKRLLSRLAGVSLHYLVGLPTYDVTNSFKMYRHAFLTSVDIESTGGFEVGMELVVKGFVRGGQITELPTTWTDRVAGTSRFRLWKWMPKYLRWYFFAFKALGPRRW